MAMVEVSIAVSKLQSVSQSNVMIDSVIYRGLGNCREMGISLPGPSAEGSAEGL